MFGFDATDYAYKLIDSLLLILFQLVMVCTSFLLLVGFALVDFLRGHKLLINMEICISLCHGVCSMELLVHLL